MTAIAVGFVALAGTTRAQLDVPVRQGNADVPDFELIAFQVVSGMRAIRGGRAPAAAENEEWVLQIRLNSYLQYVFTLQL